MPKFKEIIIQYVNVFDNTYVDLSGNTQPVQPLDIYLVPNEDKSHDRYVVDNTGVISKQSNGSQANYLRASGTDPDQQIAGSFRTQTASFHVYQNDYPYDSQFTLSPGDIELSSRVIMEDPKNPINRILVREDGIRFTTKNFICDSIPNVQGDTSYTRQLVQKDDGTIGYLTSSFESGQFDSFGQIDSFGQFPGDSISGICFYEYQKGSKYLTVRLKLYIYLAEEDGNPHGVWINVPFGLGYTQQRIFDAFTDNSLIMTTQLNEISFMKTTREAMGIGITACYTFPYGAEAGDS